MLSRHCSRRRWYAERYITQPTSMLLRLTGQEAWTDPVSFPTGCTFNGVPVEGSGAIVASTATQVTVTQALHAGRTLMLNSTHTTTVVLPAATGSGNIYTFKVGVAGTEGSKIIQVANSTDVINGGSTAWNTQATVLTFIATASDDTITMNRTTTGGLIGSTVTIQDVAAGQFLADVKLLTTGNPATPFSNAI